MGEPCLGSGVGVTLVQLTLGAEVMRWMGDRDDGGQYVLALVMEDVTSNVNGKVSSYDDQT